VKYRPTGLNRILLLNRRSPYRSHRLARRSSVRRLRADLRSGELIRSGDRCLLPDHPSHLALLPRHPGSVVTQEDLRREVWPDKTFVDFEQG